MLVKVEGKSRQDQSKERDQDGCCHRAAVCVGAGRIDGHGHWACEHKHSCELVHIGLQQGSATPRGKAEVLQGGGEIVVSQDLF